MAAESPAARAEVEFAESLGFTTTSSIVVLALPSQAFFEVSVRDLSEGGGLSSNYSMQRTALRTAADADRWTATVSQ